MHHICGDGRGLGADPGSLECLDHREDPKGQSSRMVTPALELQLECPEGIWGVLAPQTDLGAGRLLLGGRHLVFGSHAQLGVLLLRGEAQR